MAFCACEFLRTFVMFLLLIFAFLGAVGGPIVLATAICDAAGLDKSSAWSFLIILVAYVLDAMLIYSSFRAWKVVKYIESNGGTIEEAFEKTKADEMFDDVD